jgi:polyhydroxyalkanoate synthesis regulator phasin
LIEESDTQPQESTTTVTEQAVNYADFAKQAEITALWGEIDALKKQITELTAKPEKVTKRKEADSNV